MVTRIISMFLMVILAIALTAGGAIWIDREDEKRTQHFESWAATTGLPKAKTECMNKKLDKNLCSSLTADSSTTECSDGYTCWTVYVHKQDGSLFATETVERANPGVTELKVTAYQENK